jgi:hypothetical protein
MKVRYNKPKWRQGPIRWVPGALTPGVRRPKLITPLYLVLKLRLRRTCLHFAIPYSWDLIHDGKVSDTLRYGASGNRTGTGARSDPQPQCQVEIEFIQNPLLTPDWLIAQPVRSLTGIHTEWTDASLMILELCPWVKAAGAWIWSLACR